MTANGHSNGVLGRLKFLIYIAVLLVGIAGNYALTRGQVQQHSQDIRQLEETKTSKDLNAEQYRSLSERLRRIEEQLDRIEDRVNQRKR